jgi:translocation and assembly module TamA
LSALPVNKRVYAGGGASIRGYGYQAAGPLDAAGVPLGGRSVVDGGMEARAKITKHLQIAAFADAGVISPNSFPSLDEDLFIGAGGGVRYLTPIGPIRVDLAFPLEKRASDDDFQVYISLGQPF